MDPKRGRDSKGVKFTQTIQQSEYIELRAMRSNPNRTKLKISLSIILLKFDNHFIYYMYMKRIWKEISLRVYQIRMFMWFYYQKLRF